MDANMTFANISIPVQIGNDESTTYQLPPNGSLTLTNRNIGNIATIPGNIAQCLPVTSPDTFQPGQFPLAAVDGASSTKWQPSRSNISQSITVDLSSQPIQPITGFLFDWAQSPPASFMVFFHNMSGVDASSAATYSSPSVEISNPYNASAEGLIMPYTSNTTNVTLQQPLYSGTYATLIIEGNLGNPFNNGTGATVAEWAILGSSGQRLTVRDDKEQQQVSGTWKELVGRGRPGA
ncbi:MAG: hypothetical protein Q9187_009389 [Circinaria calcarea]